MSTKINNLPWTEQYRPRILSNIVEQDDIISVLTSSIKLDNLPHLLFHGPPGSGKTTTILALARQLFGPELFAERVLELNASDDRGIQVVRETIKTFAQISIKTPNNTDYPYPPFKLVILDEADAMTDDSQFALRRIIEDNSLTTRFCLICNYITRIIEPLSSRCIKFKFKPINQQSMEKIIGKICLKEQIECSRLVMDKLYEVSNGDLRKAITFLQKTYYIDNKRLTLESLYNIIGLIPIDFIITIINKLKKNVTYEQLKLMCLNILSDGYVIINFIEKFLIGIINDTSIPDKQKGLISFKCANINIALINGSDEYLQLLTILAYTKEVLHNNYIL